MFRVQGVRSDRLVAEVEADSVDTDLVPPGKVLKHAIVLSVLCVSAVPLFHGVATPARRSKT
eukprot:3934604-Rhodomonas_salina.5